MKNRDSLYYSLIQLILIFKFCINLYYNFLILFLHRINYSLKSMILKLPYHHNQLRDSLEKEKKLRSDVEKVKRKVDGDLRSSQDVAEELEGNKRSLEENNRK